jgi:3-oxoacyl-[acyl-carrier-protein] synthase II
VLTLQDQWLPGNYNLTNPLASALDLLPPEGRAVSGVRAVLSNSFGFGGTNASVVLTREHAI